MKATKLEVAQFRALVIKVFFDDGYELWFWPFDKLMGYEGLGHVELRNSKRGQELVARYNDWESLGGGRQKLTKCDPPMTPQQFAAYWHAALDHYSPLWKEAVNKGRLTDDLRDFQSFVMGTQNSANNLKRSQL